MVVLALAAMERHKKAKPDPRDRQKHGLVLLRNRQHEEIVLALLPLKALD